MANQPAVPAAQDAIPPGIRLDHFILVKADTELLQPLPSGLEDLAGESHVGVRAARYTDDPDRVRVEIEYDSSTEYLRLALTYRMEFVRIGPEPEDREAFWRRMVARYGPSITMPYVRTMVHSLTSSMGSVGFLVPILNYGNIFKADEIELGSISDTSSDDEVDAPAPPATSGRKSPSRTRSLKKGK